MKVALGSIFPYDERYVRGGLEAVALYLTQALSAREDIELHVVSCNPHVKSSFSEKRGTVTFHWIPTSRRFAALRAASINALRVRNVYRRIQPDVIHAQGFSEYAVGARSSDCLLLSIHGMEALVHGTRGIMHFRGIAGFYRRVLSNWIARKSIWNARGIISNAGDYAPRLLSQYLDDKAIYFIGNPIADEFFSIQDTQHKAELIVLWVGTISERKNLIGLVKVFEVVARQIPEAQLWLVGHIGESGYGRLVEEEIKARQLEDRINVVGTVDQHMLLDAYTKAEVVILTSLEETAPMVLAQAMAASKPVVATRVGGIPWMIEEGISGYLTSIGDECLMADRLLELLSNPEKCQRMGKEARRRALRLFRAENVAEATAGAYRDLLSMDMKGD